MAYAEPAYRLDSYPDFAPESQRGDSIHVFRTGSREEGREASLLVTAAKMAAIVFVVVAILAFARIALTSATVTTMIESDSISSKISDARSAGVSLEMEQSVLSNTAAINAASKRLGMAAPYEVGTIELSPDIVTVDAQGDLSLSGTVKKLVETQG